MSGPALSFSKALAQIEFFRDLEPAQRELILEAAALRFLDRGEAAVLESAPVNDLFTVLSGALASTGGETVIARGSLVEPDAFFCGGVAHQTLFARRKTALLSLSRADLAILSAADESLFAAVMQAAARLSRDKPRRMRPSRIALCETGDGLAARQLKARVVEAFERLGEVRVLTQKSFGTGQPGEIDLDDPANKEWLLEQDIAFDLTLIDLAGSNTVFAESTIDEADEILILSGGGSSHLTSVEQVAFQRRGADATRLLMTEVREERDFKAWRAPRPCLSSHIIRADSQEADTHAACSLILGHGLAIAAFSAGAHAAAILGALEALLAAGFSPQLLGAGGSAVLPAGLLAAGHDPVMIAGMMDRFSGEEILKQAAIPASGVLDPAPVEAVLDDPHFDSDISMGKLPFIGVASSLSFGKGALLASGPLRYAVRAGLLPAFLLPPLVTEAGDILVSGGLHQRDVIQALRKLAPLPVILLRTIGSGLGPVAPSAPGMRSPAFLRWAQREKRQTEPRLGLTSLLAAAATPAPEDVRAEATFEIPIAHGVMPLDWSAWRTLRDEGFIWMSRQLQAGAADELANLRGA